MKSEYRANTIQTSRQNVLIHKNRPSSLARLRISARQFQQEKHGSALRSASDLEAELGQPEGHTLIGDLAGKTEVA